jgi:hypothetical protein
MEITMVLTSLSRLNVIIGIEHFAQAWQRINTQEKLANGAF